MIEERRCSYEVCKLLHKKGFDIKCTDWYWENNFNIWKPTHQMACDWLREVYKIFIEISVSIDLNGDYHYRYSILNKKCEYLRKGYTSFDWTFGDAVEEALKYSLENLV